MKKNDKDQTGEKEWIGRENIREKLNWIEKKMKKENE